MVVLSSWSSRTASLSGCDLFRYSPFGLTALDSCSSSTNKCILLGGLSDGLWPVPYTQPLQELLHEQDSSWSLVQPILSSSYTGFGHGSLDRDVEEMDQLMETLLERTGATTTTKSTTTSSSSDAGTMKVCLIGHSTGCQDIVHYLQNGKFVQYIKCVALQAPVSDRQAAVLDDDQMECPEKQKEQEELVQLATKLRNENKGDEMMPRAAFWAPITANRYYDLNAKGGADDYFSSDYTDDELMERLGHVGKISTLQTCLLAWSGSDEYVSNSVNGKEHLERMVQAMNCSGREVATGLYLADGNHNLSQGPDDIPTFIQSVKEMLAK